MKPTSYLPAEGLLARYPGRLSNINAALAACYLANGQAVPESLLPSIDSRVDKSETARYVDVQEDL